MGRAARTCWRRCGRTPDFLARHAPAAAGRHGPAAGPHLRALLRQMHRVAGPLVQFRKALTAVRRGRAGRADPAAGRRPADGSCGRSSNACLAALCRPAAASRSRRQGGTGRRRGTGRKRRCGFPPPIGPAAGPGGLRPAGQQPWMSPENSPSNRSRAAARSGGVVGGSASGPRSRHRVRNRRRTPPLRAGGPAFPAAATRHRASGRRGRRPRGRRRTCSPTTSPVRPGWRTPRPGSPSEGSAAIRAVGRTMPTFDCPTRSSRSSVENTSRTTLFRPYRPVSGWTASRTWNSAATAASRRSVSGTKASVACPLREPRRTPPVATQRHHAPPTPGGQLHGIDGLEPRLPPLERVAVREPADPRQARQPPRRSPRTARAIRRRFFPLETSPCHSPIASNPNSPTASRSRSSDHRRVVGWPSESRGAAVRPAGRFVLDHQGEAGEPFAVRVGKSRTPSAGGAGRGETRGRARHGRLEGSVWWRRPAAGGCGGRGAGRVTAGPAPPTPPRATAAAGKNRNPSGSTPAVPSPQPAAGRALGRSLPPPRGRFPRVNGPTGGPGVAGRSHTPRRGGGRGGRPEPARPLFGPCAGGAGPGAGTAGAGSEDAELVAGVVGHPLRRPGRVHGQRHVARPDALHPLHRTAGVPDELRAGRAGGAGEGHRHPSPPRPPPAAASRRRPIRGSTMLTCSSGSITSLRASTSSDSAGHGGSRRAGSAGRGRRCGKFRGGRRGRAARLPVDAEFPAPPPSPAPRGTGVRRSQRSRT